MNIGGDHTNFTPDSAHAEFPMEIDVEEPCLINQGGGHTA
jgi:hypothetical protein